MKNPEARKKFDWGLNPKSPDPQSELRRQDRDFGLIVGGVVLIVFGIFLPWRIDRSPSAWPFAIGLPLIFLALVRPNSLGGLRKVWMNLAKVLGYVNSRAILFFIYVMLVLPTGVIRRMLGSDSLRLRQTERVETFRTPSVDTQNFKEPF